MVATARAMQAKGSPHAFHLAAMPGKRTATRSRPPAGSAAHRSRSR